ncbi:DUF4397 domain-containing protein [Mucilaginibacter terrae]|uniref:DUF4397 domain-containing protein n=1 Tax=Mucilaginibacter terrae TaxID=1955052 RepID=UPI003639CCEB
MIKNLRVNALLTLLLFTMAACVKNDPAPTIVGLEVNVNVINASDDILNFYLNGTRQNSTTGIFPLAASGYTDVPYASQLAFRRLFNNQTFDNSEILFTVPVTVDTTGTDNRRYSLFTAGPTANTAFILRDTIVSDTGNAKLRFVVASPETTKLKVTLNDTLYFTTTAFKSASVFKPVGGTGVKAVEIRDADTNTLLYSTRLTLNVGNNYTLFSQGRVTDRTFKAGLTTNQ